MNDTGRLPVISGANGEKPQSRGGSRDRPQTPNEAQMAASKFNAVLQQLSSIPFPPIASDLSVKARLGNLEGAAISQSDFNNTAIESFGQLNSSLHAAEDVIKQFLKQTQDSFDAKLAALKKEYDHRFDLQNSENKRLQSHVTNLKADTNLLKQKLVYAYFLASPLLISLF